MNVIALDLPVPVCTPVDRTQAPAAVDCKGILAAWLARHRHRRMLRDDLLPQPDSVLEDAGITRRQAQAEAAKPFWRA